jgi:hypothetical protein
MAATPVVVKKPATKELVINSITLECSECSFHLVRDIDISPEGKTVTYVCPNPDCENQGQHYAIKATVVGTEVSK